MGPKEALTSNDAVLGEVLRVLQEEQVPYTALFTARRAGAPPRPGGLPVDFGGPRRALLARGEGEGPEVPPPLRWPPQGDPKMLLWARNLSVTFGGAAPGPDPPNLRARGRRGHRGLLVGPRRGQVCAEVPGRVWGDPERHVPVAPLVVPGLGAPLGVAGGDRGHPGGGSPRPVRGSGRGRPLPPRVALWGPGDPPAAPPPPGAQPALEAAHPRPAGTPKTPRNTPKIPPKHTKIPQKIPQKQPKISPQNSPKQPQNNPKQPKNTPENTPKTPRNTPQKYPKTSPKIPQNSPKIPQKYPRTYPKNTPKYPPKIPQTSPKIPQNIPQKHPEIPPPKYPRNTRKYPRK
ncbi:uncharacterized protein [Chamaea fasciata]|uniref:uncharacterized protein isoform X1 n=1 Tax=Chamaea fasciata TaxID=190680 RepID=UPI00336AC3B5